MLSNAEKRDYYDRTGRIADSEDDMREADAFMEDLMRQFFGGDGSSFDDFDEFVNILESGSDKAFRKMFRDLGKQTRIRNQPRNARKAALNKGGGGSKRQQKQMEKDMVELMMGMPMPGMPGMDKKKRNKKKRGKVGRDSDDSDDDEFDEEEMEDMMMAMMMGGMMPPGFGGPSTGKGKKGGKGAKKGGVSEQELFE